MGHPVLLRYRVNSLVDFDKNHLENVSVIRQKIILHFLWYSHETISQKKNRRTPNVDSMLVHAGPALGELILWDPSKHETFTQCWYNVGPSSTTLAQHCTNIGSTSCVCWDMFVCSFFSHNNSCCVFIVVNNNKQGTLWGQTSDMNNWTGWDPLEHWCRLQWIFCVLLAPA